MAQGKITAYVGCMGSGKTKKLIELYNKFTSSDKRVLVIKHYNDVIRSGKVGTLTSRDGSFSPSISLQSLASIDETVIDQFDIFLIDEIQFFSDDFTLDILESLAINGKDVYVFGLDLTSDMETFGIMGDILAISDRVHKLSTKCHICGQPARVSQYIGGNKTSQVKVGDLGDYQPTCRSCFIDSEYSVNDIEDKSEDKYYEIELIGNDFVGRIGVYLSELEEAGYTIEQVKDINSFEGFENLIEDLNSIMKDDRRG